MFQLKFLPIFALLPGLFFTNTALGEDNEPKQVERLEVFTTANFKQLCTAPKTYNVPAYAIKSQAAALYLAAADVQHTALLDSLAKHDESQPPLSNAATNLADQPSRFSTRMNQYSQARADSFRETQNAQKYTKNNVTMMVSPRAIVERLQTNLNTFTEDELRNSEENKYLKMAISFHLWTLNEGMKGQYPYGLEYSPALHQDGHQNSSRTKQNMQRELEQFLLENSSVDVFHAFIGENTKLKVTCDQPYWAKAGLSKRLRLRKDAANLKHAVDSNEAAGAELSFSRTKTMTEATDEKPAEPKTVTSLGFTGTLGYNPFEKHDNFFVYTTYEYDDNDETVSDINDVNKLACENEDNFDPDDPDGCGLDGDKRETVTLGIIGDFWTFKLSDDKVNKRKEDNDYRLTLNGNLYAIQDLARNSEQYTLRLRAALTNKGNNKLLGKGIRAGNIGFSWSPHVWAQGTYVADVGSSTELQGLLFLNGNKREGGYGGFGIGNSAKLSWKQLSLEAEYKRLFVSSDKINNQQVYILSAGYQFPSLRNTKIKFSYEKGNKLDSFNEIDKLELKLTFLY